MDKKCTILCNQLSERIIKDYVQNINNESETSISSANIDRNLLKNTLTGFFQNDFKPEQS